MSNTFRKENIVFDADNHGGKVICKLCMQHHVMAYPPKRRALGIDFLAYRASEIVQKLYKIL